MPKSRSPSRPEGGSSPGQIEWVRAGELVPSQRNARTHSKKQIRQIADSIREFGFVNPVVIDRHCRVVAGHGRLEAARLLGLAEIPTISVAHLSEAAVRAYALADKPVALVVDAIRDCSRRDDIVLDAFAGSGTTMMAAERIGRRAYCLELDPLYADVS